MNGGMGEGRYKGAAAQGHNGLYFRFPSREGQVVGFKV